MVNKAERKEAKSPRQDLKGQLDATRLLQQYGMDLRTWEILVLIGLNEGEGTVALAKKANIPKSAFSRNVRFLCSEQATRGNDSGKPMDEKDRPARLVQRAADPRDVRLQCLHLTNEGEKLLQKVTTLMSH